LKASSRSIVVSFATSIFLAFLAALSIRQAPNAVYGYSLFAVAPLVASWFLVAWLPANGSDLSLRPSLVAAVSTVAWAGAWILVSGIDGFICIVMAWPIAFGGAVLGASLGWALRSWWRRSRGAAAVGFALLPGLVWAEGLLTRDAPLRSVTTSVEIAAPAARVWASVVAFPPLDEPVEWLFRAGLAYPIFAEIDGQGPGAIRRCVFSTGTFVEPIEIWDEPRRLAFSVTEVAPPMRELSPYPHLRSEHLEGFLVSERGEFRLESLADGTTLLHGTTWYRNRMWPQVYWNLWADAIVHRIHRRVLDHVRDLSESPTVQWKS
jgi:hypothetical protein